MKGFNRRVGLLRHLIGISVLLLSIVSLPAKESLADTSPNFDPACAPFGPNSCASRVPGPWKYQYTVFCAIGGPYTTEARALQDVATMHKNACSFDIQATGSWLVQGPTTISKCGTLQNFSSLPFRNMSTLFVTRDFKPYEVTHVSARPSCSNTITTEFEMERVREITCPSPQMSAPSYGTAVVNGTSYSQQYCRGVNEAKDFGEVCCTNRKAGNPINVGTGNKVQVERDYSGGSTGLLRFDRYYNSAGHRHGNLSNFGEAWVARLGKHWRHIYDRQVMLVESGSLITAFVYRHDGKILWYNLYNDVWYSDADVSSKLERLSSGGVYTGWKLTNSADGSVELYDSLGLLQSITNRSGTSVTMSYDVNGLLAAATDSFGHQVQFTYDSNSQLSSVAVPGGATYQYEYDSASRLSSVTNPDGSNKAYYYNESGHIDSGANLAYALTGIEENGQRFATYKYYSDGRAKSSEHAGGVELTTVSYPSDTQRTVVDASGTSRRYGVSMVSGVRRTTSISQPCASCGAAATTYDTSGNVSSRTTFNGSKTCYAYDLARNLETVRVEGFATGVSCPADLTAYAPTAGTTQRKIVTLWHATYRQPTQVDEPGKRTTFTHDASGNVLTKTELDTATSASRTWTYTYNSFGQMLTADGPRTDVSDVTTFTYYTCTTGYQCGQIHTVTNAANHTATYNTYNAHGQPLTITDPNGVVTTLAYDLRQRLTSRNVLGEVTTFEYWPTGLLKKATLPDASYLEYTYDAAHRLTEIADSEGNRIEYTLDAMGNRTAEQVYDPSNALSQVRTRVFDTLNRLWKEIGAAGTTNVTTTFGYDNNGNQTGIAAPLGRNTSQSYDELNRLTQVTDPLSGVTQYGYNALDQLIAVTDPRGKVTSYTNNALGDLTQQVSPDTGTTTQTYDSAGNLATTTDARGKTATYGYDALNRVTSLSYPDQTISYTYDSGVNQNGRLIQITDGSGSTSWTYDAQGRVLSRQQSMGIAKSVGYAYDAAGRLQTLTLPSGHTIGYAYTNGKVTSLTLNGSTTILSNVLYQPFGPTRGWTWGNATLSVREFDADGNLTDLDSAGLKSYSYDDAFRITGISDASDPSRSQSYGYDPLDRLTSATGASLNQGWTYDANGNRLTQTGDQPATYTVSGTSNGLSSVSGATTRSYAYSASGSVTGDGMATFTYDDAGRLVSATKGSVITSYAINALGQRVRKTSAGASTYFVYDEVGHLLGEYDTAGALIQETVWFGDIPVATIRPGGASVELFYVHADHLNTPRRISRPSDNVIVWRWDSDPFGATAANEEPDGDSSQFTYHLRFPGQYFDAETGLHYNYHRDYDPSTGRYVQSDPIGLKGGINTYSYAGNDPVSSTDPSGLLIQAPRSGCSPTGWAKVQQAEKRIRDELAKPCECTPDSSGSCIPCNLRPQLLNALDTTVVRCPPLGTDCGWGDVGGNSIKVMPPAFGHFTNNCVCLALTVYHELLHNVGLYHYDGIAPMEKRCEGNLCGNRPSGPLRRW